MAGLTAEKQARLDTHKADLAADPSKTARQLQAQQAKMRDAITRLESLAQAISDERVAELRAAEANFTTAQMAVAAASANLFSGEPLPDIGSEAWKILWDSARAYSQNFGYPDQLFPVTGPNARCVLCQQELDTAAADRLNRFEAFIQNESKKREQSARTVFQNALSMLATVHLMLTREAPMNVQDAAAKVYACNSRKKRFLPDQIEIAFETLRVHGWLPWS